MCSRYRTAALSEGAAMNSNSMIGKTEFIVQMHESGPDQKARVKSIFHYLQTTADTHSRSLGTSVTFMSGQNLTWVYTRFYAFIDRYPDMYEKIECETWRFISENGIVSREFIIRAKNGETLVRATASLALIDTKIRKPVAIPDFIRSQFDYSKGRSIEFPSSSIRQMDESDFTYNVQLRYEDIDINQHMNNASYAGIFYESIYKKFREQFVLKSIDISFRTEIIYGDELECRVTSYKDTSGRFYQKLVSLDTGKTCTHAVSEWIINRDI